MAIAPEDRAPRSAPLSVHRIVVAWLAVVGCDDPSPTVAPKPKLSYDEYHRALDESTGLTEACIASVRAAFDRPTLAGLAVDKPPPPLPPANRPPNRPPTTDQGHGTPERHWRPSAEIVEADLGDVRLIHRLVLLVDSLADRSGESFPNTLDDARVRGRVNM